MSILDTFVILFKTNAKDAEKEIRGVDKAGKDLEKNLQQTSNAADQLTKSFYNAAEAAISAVGAYFTFGAFKSGITNAANFNFEIAKQSKLIGINSDELSAWGAAFARVTGGDVREFSGYLASITNELSGRGMTDQVKNMPEYLLEAADSLKKLHDEGRHGDEVTLAKQLYIPPEYIPLLEKGRVEVENIVNALKARAQITKENEKASEDFKAATQELDLAWLRFFNHFIPLGTSFIGMLTSLVDKLSSFEDWVWGTKKAIPAPMTGNNKEESRKFWLSKGYSEAQTAALMAQEERESGYGKNLVGDNGRSIGIFQWDANRRAKILAGTGIDVTTASHNDQLRAAAWELDQRGHSDVLRRMNDPAEAASYLSHNFEIPANGAYEAALRGQMALRIADTSPLSSAPAQTSQKNVNIGNITINTQATDAKGIADALEHHLNQEYRTTIGNFDDGVMY